MPKAKRKPTVAAKVKKSFAQRSAPKTPYSDRTDLEKLGSQWKKLQGLHLRDESSAAIVRCATAAEIAANYAIRHEFAERSQFDAEIVDGFLFWANGLKGKMDRLFVPIYFAKTKDPVANELKKLAEKINRVRNGVVHQGEFATQKLASETIEHAKRFINLIVGLSKPGFDIEDGSYTKEPSASKPSQQESAPAGDGT